MHEDVYKFGGIKGKGEWLDLEEQREKDTWMTAQQMLRDLESRMNKVEYGRKEGREDGLMQVGINAWLSAHICTSAHLHMPTSAQVATMLGWLHKQMPSSCSWYMQCTWNLEYGGKERRKDGRMV